jgi:hypothetical protein
LHTLSAVYTTGGIAGTREPRLVLDDGTNIAFNGAEPTGQSGSTALRYTFAGAGAAVNGLSLSGFQRPIPPAVILRAGWRIRVLAQNAADQWSAPVYIVEEWMEV